MNICLLITFADDIDVTKLICNDKDSYCRQEIDHVGVWCDDNCLELNVKKTKEMFVDFRKDKMKAVRTAI